MNNHSCLLCIGSNFERHSHIASARKALLAVFPEIRFGTEMETEAIGGHFHSPFSNQVAKFHTSLPVEKIRILLKEIEKENGRTKEDKAMGIVRLDIDILMYDDTILKPEDLARDYVQKGIYEISSPA